MKRAIVILSVFAALSVLFAACTKTGVVANPDAPQQTGADELSQSAAKSKFQKPINFTAPNVFPEGLVYDPFNDQFLVSSISMGTVGAVTRKGVYSPFIQDAALASTSGLKIDKARKRLVVTNTKADGSLAQLAIYNLTTKTRLFLVDLAAVANDGAPHLINDVVLDQQGNAYATDSYAGIIYKVDNNGNASIFYRNPAYTPALGGFGFNGIEYSSSKGGYLLVAHTALAKIVKIPIDNPKALTTVKFSPAITSPDGILLSKNNKQLIVVNNTAGGPGSNVTSFESTDSWATACSIGEKFSTGVVYPTTVTSDGKTEYVLYSYIHLLFGGQQKETFTIQSLPFNSNNPF